MTREERVKLGLEVASGVLNAFSLVPNGWGAAAGVLGRMTGALGTIVGGLSEDEAIVILEEIAARPPRTVDREAVRKRAQEILDQLRSGT